MRVDLPELLGIVWVRYRPGWIGQACEPLTPRPPLAVVEGRRWYRVALVAQAEQVADLLREDVSRHVGSVFR